MSCPRCGIRLRRDARFCQRCGALVEGLSQADEAAGSPGAPSPRTQEPEPLGAPPNRPGVRFWTAWVLASGLASNLATLLVRDLPIPPPPWADRAGMLLVDGLVMGLAIGAGQWLVLRQWFPNAGLWIVATASGFALAGLLTPSLAPAFMDAPAALGAADAAVAGLAQWVVLRKWVAGANWWVLVAALGGAAAQRVGPAAPGFAQWLEPGPFLQAVFGASLLWVLSRSAPAWQRRGRAEAATLPRSGEEAAGGTKGGGFWRGLATLVRILVGLAVLALTTVVVGGWLARPATDPTGAAVWITVAAFTAFLLLAWRPRRLLRRVALGLALGAILGAGTYFFGSAREIEYLSEHVGFLQDAMAEVAVAKSIGDEIVLGRVNVGRGRPVFVALAARYESHPVERDPTGPDMESVRERADAIYQLLWEMPVSDPLFWYGDSVRSWAWEVTRAADGVIAQGVDSPEAAEQWRRLRAEPDPVAMSRIRVSGAAAPEVLARSLEKIASVKEFGELASAQGDRETMRYVAARLHAQSYWLQALARSQGAPVCQQGRGGGVLRGPAPAAPRRCLEDVQRLLPSLYKSAWSYVAQEPEAPQRWADAWAQVAPVIEEAGTAIGGAGISTGEPEERMPSPRVKSFIDQCEQKGGVVGGTGGVMSGLPTTESGWSCWYPPAPTRGPTCWDLLTYSGGRYMGGEQGCPLLGVLVQRRTAPSEALPEPVGTTSGPVSEAQESSGGSGGRTVRCPADAPYLWSDGRCHVCPAEYPYRHSDGKCYAQRELRCPSNAPYLWSDGRCHACPAEYPYKHSDGKCYTQPELRCPSNAPYLWSDGLCHACPGEYPYKHSDGMCYTQPELRCPANAPYLWSDGLCHACPATHPYKHSDGRCYTSPETPVRPTATPVQRSPTPPGPTGCSLAYCQLACASNDAQAIRRCNCDCSRNLPGGFP